jgi:pimeloyl-ACP methyl ester carboxylesterase
MIFRTRRAIIVQAALLALVPAPLAAQAAVTAPQALVAAGPSPQAALATPAPVRPPPPAHMVSHHRTVEGHGGVPIAVQEWGNPDGPPLVLLHGFNFAAASFKHQIGDISSKLRIIAPDLRGHGFSGKPWKPEDYAGTKIWADDLDAVLTALKVRHPVLLGWSFGGYVAMDYVRHCTTNCPSAIVLTSSLAGLVPRPSPPDPQKSGLPPPAGDSRVDDFHDVFLSAGWLARAMSSAPPSALQLQQNQFMVMMTPPYARRAMLGLSLENRDLAPKLAYRMLLISGADDLSIPQESIAALRAALPAADVQNLVYPGVGHSPFSEAPDRFNADLLAFTLDSHARTPR